MLPVMSFWTNFSQGIFEYSINAYSNLEPWTYPLIFMGIIGYVFMATHSIVTSIVAILITLGIYSSTTDIFANIPDLSLFLYIVTLVGITLLVMVLILKVVDRI